MRGIERARARCLGPSTDRTSAPAGVRSRDGILPFRLLVGGDYGLAIAADSTHVIVTQAKATAAPAWTTPRSRTRSEAVPSGRLGNRWRSLAHAPNVR